MTKIKNKILVIDDEESFRDSIRLCLEDENTQIIAASDGEEGLKLFKVENPDLVITDLLMPKMTGIEVLHKIKSENLNTPVIILTAHENVRSTIEAMKDGAYDYATKPIHVSEFRLLISQALSANLEKDNKNINISDIYTDHSSDYGLLGKTAVMRELIKQIGPISLNRTSILIEVENGTGKEILARTIHRSGITKNHPFIGVNCTALSSSLLESELFGHDKGSFTGAFRSRKGKFELAAEGTLFLDEVSEMPMDMQVKLLRVLQEKEFERVGGEVTIPFKARVVAATNRNLFSWVKENKFRQDLFHRLNVIHLRIPPLRERKEDIPALAIYLLGKINKELNKNVIKIPYETMEWLQENNWYGNVRELENTLRRAVVLAKSDTIEKEHVILPSYNQDEPLQPQLVTLAKAEKKYIQFVLNHVNWNKHHACEILDITKPTLLKKIKDYNLQPHDKE